MEQITLRRIYGTYIIDKKIKPSSQSNIYNLFNNCIGDWWHLEIGKVTEEMVECRFKEIADEKKTPTQADNCFRWFRAIYNYAAIKHKKLKRIPKSNPTQRLTELDMWRPAPARQSYIKEKDLKKWTWEVLMVTNTTCRDYLLTLMLTAFRHSEACGLTWNNVDLENGFVTTIDPKNGHDHTVPMCIWLWEMMLERKKHATNEWVFPAKKPRRTPTKRAGKGNFTTPYGIIRELVNDKGVAKFTPHDLRRTWNNVAKRLGIDKDTRKMVLNHRPQDVTGKHYDVYEPEEVRWIMEAVCREIMSKAELLPKPAAQAHLAA